ncbi:antirestriction protein ArdA [Thalassobaculum litoreum]|uniref:Antirestriction protein (ArdA) n=1 Tax=Thalassobaculum litoreum DSM 18839 TaxID=1123362 RepID=A0A8G2BKU8_9PROT|nr:antirestriction protein ArdA [Thalassobaculum litoreum]SDG28997.1 Antirestriction protein (ArdA) [Thalassobaculum litoreum DSM 18839]
MTTTLHAQPYDISASGFYFETVEQYEAKAAKAINDYGASVEEFEIQFIDGEEIDCALAGAWALNQANFAAYLDAVGQWDEDRKQRYIIAVGECGYDHEQVADDPDAGMVDIYQMDTLRELAEAFVDEGLFGDIPEAIARYLDYDAIARDLGMDYAETTIAGQRLIYRCD